MQPSISILTLTLKAGAALAANRFVESDGTYPTAGGTALGVTRTSAGAIGDLVPIDVMGTANAEAGGAVSVGDELQVDNAGKVVERTTGVCVGVALTAGGDGSLVEVLLHLNSTPPAGGA
jgi:hypothetical protein